MSLYHFQSERMKHSSSVIALTLWRLKDLLSLCLSCVCFFMSACLWMKTGFCCWACGAFLAVSRLSAVSEMIHYASSLFWKWADCIQSTYFFYLPPFEIGGIKDNLIRLLIVLLLLSFQCRVSQQAGILGFAKSINGTFILLQFLLMHQCLSWQ